MTPAAGQPEIASPSRQRKPFEPGEGISSSAQSSYSVARIWGVRVVSKRVEKASATHWSW